MPPRPDVDVPTTVADLEARFDGLYARAQALGQRRAADLCAIGCGTCARARAAPEKAPFCCGDGDDFPGNRRCPHLGPEGCTVRSLRCALWYCDSVRLGTRRVRIRGLHAPFQTVALPLAEALVAEADAYGFLVWRGTRAQSLRQAARRWGLPA